MHFVETKQTVTQHNLVVHRMVFQQYWPGFQCFCRSSFISVNSCLSLTLTRIGHGLTSLYPETPQKFCELRSRDFRLLKSMFLIQDLASLFGWCVCVVVNVLSCSDFFIYFFKTYLQKWKWGILSYCYSRVHLSYSPNSCLKDKFNLTGWCFSDILL